MNDKRNQSARRSLFVVSTSSLGLSLLLPWLISWSPDLAGAAAAALTFIALYLLAFSLSVYLLGLSLVSWKRLGKRQRVLGVVPFILVAIVGVAITSQLEF